MSGGGIKKRVHDLLTELVTFCETLNLTSEESLGGLAKKLLADIEESQATTQEIENAREIYALDDELAVDDDAQASRSEEGAWIQAWVWMPAYDEEEQEVIDDQN